MTLSGRNLAANLFKHRGFTTTLVPRVIRCFSEAHICLESLKQLEQDVETVINILQPGPLGIIEHKFTAEEVKEAESIVKKAVKNWERNESFQRK